MNLDFNYIISVSRSVSGNSQEPLFALYRTLKLKKAGVTPQDSASKIYEAVCMINEWIPHYEGDESICYEMFRRIYDFTLDDCFAFINLVQANCGKGRDFLVVPDCLADLMVSGVDNGKSVYFTDCECFAASIYNLVKSNNNLQIYTSSKNAFYAELMKLLFEGFNVQFIEGDYYKDGFCSLKFDYIVCLPVMGCRVLGEDNRNFISRDLAFIATQNLLCHITADGELRIVLPAKVGFGGGDITHFRDFIYNSYKIKEINSLPNRVFYPFMAINTYYMVFGNGSTDDVIVRKYDMENGKLSVNPNNDRLLFSDEFEALNGWSIETVFVEKNEDIERFESSNIKKNIISDVADVFRGKSVTEKTDDGNIHVINISNITETGIDYESLDRITEEERKVSRYILEDGDVLVTSRGTLVKIAVFHDNGRVCIPSANINVIRCKKKLLMGEYLKLFLESPVGNGMLKGLQRGFTVVNINYQDILTIEVPVPPMDKQRELVEKYNEGLKTYRELISTAEELWSRVKSEIQDDLF